MCRQHYIALKCLFATVAFASLTTVRSLIATKPVVRRQWSHWLALARVAPFFTQKSHAQPGDLITL